MDVYETVPVMESDRYLLRGVIEEQDTKDLLEVYSDEKAVPIFNSDNCSNNFYFTTIEEMKEMIRFWIWEYKERHYVRWAIVDKTYNKVVGTMELFNRQAEDYFDNCGLLRLDLRSDYEKQEVIENLLSIIIPETEEMFHCSMIATKAIPEAVERIQALQKYGFQLSKEYVAGHDGTKYGHYYVREVYNYGI